MYPALACTTRNELEGINEVLNSRLQVLDALEGDQQAAIEEAHPSRNRYNGSIDWVSTGIGSTVRSIGSGSMSKAYRTESVSGRLLKSSSAVLAVRRKMCMLR
jgi:hypothetical protein